MFLWGIARQQETEGSFHFIGLLSSESVKKLHLHINPLQLRVFVAISNWRIDEGLIDYHNL
jgi:hypothetical protein